MTAVTTARESPRDAGNSVPREPTARGGRPDSQGRLQGTDPTKCPGGSSRQLHSVLGAGDQDTGR